MYRVALECERQQLPEIAYATIEKSIKGSRYSDYFYNQVLTAKKSRFSTQLLQRMKTLKPTPTEGAGLEDLERRLEEAERSATRAEERSMNNEGKILDLEQRMIKEETYSKQHDAQIAGLDERADQADEGLRAANKSLLEKVDCETFDAEIAYLKELLQAIAKGGDKPIEIKAPPPSTGASLSTKDMMMLRDLGLKVPEIEKNVRDLLARVKTLEKSS